VPFGRALRDVTPLERDVGRLVEIDVLVDGERDRHVVDDDA
jgi:hypothetical protein